eukprot:TRINITY_DN83_c0_g2_i1.p1 TRINITY_DN83_c0_g2~~TRINITY_DN83_c0_g2_i1.p1  ORF type:complete len:141 (-),score=13.05 TRINITY_DN83_c0_g2_i1:29-451(-)
MEHFEYLSHLTDLFQKISLSQDIEVTVFLDACSEMNKIFDIFGARGLSIVKNDIAGNIKIKDAWQANGASLSLQGLILKEKSCKKLSSTKNSGSEGLLWLNRALQFKLAFMLRFAARDEGTLNEIIRYCNQFNMLCLVMV